MLLTNVEKEIRGIMRVEGISQSEVARRRGVTRQTVNDSLSRPVLVKGFIETMEAMGYDVEIEFVRRKV